MKAGRELDALVAEKVMGWVWEQRSDNYVPPDPHRYLAPYSTNSPAWKAADMTAPAFLNGSQPHYSTEIVAAWQVVEHFAAKGWYWELSPDGDERWCLLQQEPHDEDVVYGWNATAPTTPLAICLAALKTVGVELTSTANTSRASVS